MDFFSIDRVESQSELAFFARGAIDWFHRRAAVLRLEDQAILVTIAQSDGYWLVRRAATTRLTTISVLMNIMVDDVDRTVRRTALDRLVALGAIPQSSDFIVGSKVKASEKGSSGFVVGSEVKASEKGSSGVVVGAEVVNTSVPTVHTQDSDCTLDDDLQCVVCGVSHTETCPSCGGRGFHLPTCEEMVQ